MNDMIVNELVIGFQEIFKERLVSIILYGSVARGTESSESDVDIAVIVKDAKTKMNQEQIIDFALELDFKYDKVFSVIDIDYDEFKKWEDILPFYRNVNREGIVIWKAA